MNLENYHRNEVTLNVVNVKFSYMLVKTPSEDHFWHMLYVIQKYV